MSNELREMTIEKYHQLIMDGKLSAKEMVAFYLERIQQLDQSINAIISVNKEAIQMAEALDERYKLEGFVGPLHGVPLLVKDNVETKNIPTTAGSISMSDYVPKEDAFIIDKLKAAGAIVIAKTNLHEFAIWGETISSVLGQTLNPYDFKRTPGGSSGGTGAALAADFGLLGIGTDTINSIRSPASANALVGIRPTVGLVSRRGIVPYSYTQDTAGPMARTVVDAVKMLDAMKGFDPLDDATAWSFAQSNEKLVDSLNATSLKGMKIGVLESLFGTEKRHEAINLAVREAIGVLKSCGAEILPLYTPFDTDALVKSVSLHLHDFKDHLNHYFAAIKDDLKIKDFDMLIESGLYHPGVKANLEMANQLTTASDAYRLRFMDRLKLQTQLMQLMALHQLDALVYPHQKQLVCEVGESQNERNGVLASVTGFPAFCVPAGFSMPSPSAPIGLPIGMEIMGRPFSEAILSQIAVVYERTANVRRAPRHF